MESGGESNELLKPGDIAITTSPQAGAPLLGEGIMVQVDSVGASSGLCVWARRFPLGAEQHAIATDWLKLFWRPGAPDPK